MKTSDAVEIVNSLREVAEAFEAANGRRRVRTTDAYGILKNEAYTWHAGHVANSYKFPAYATAFCILPDSTGQMYCHVKEVSARKGTSGFGDLLVNRSNGPHIVASDEKIRTGIPVPSADEAQALLDSGVLSAEDAELVRYCL